MTFLLAPKRFFFYFYFFYIESRMSSIHFYLAQFRQILFLGLSKYLPESDFYLPRATGQVVINVIHKVSLDKWCTCTQNW